MLDFIAGQQHFKVLESALNVSNLRHRVITNNIANVDTPNFRRSEVAFESYLKDYLDKTGSNNVKKSNKLSVQTTNSRHIDKYEQDDSLFLGATVRTVHGQTMRTDGNNVDIDIEMADMAKNTLYYQAVAQRVNGYFTGLKGVIDGR